MSDQQFLALIVCIFTCTGFLLIGITQVRDAIKERTDAEARDGAK